jgi:uncharacterized protein YlxW (UPF0749 family)
VSPATAQGEERTRPRDPAASMALLRELVNDDAAQEYAEAHRRHAGSRPSTGSKALLLLCVALASGLLVTALVQNRAVAPEKELAREQLVQRAQAAQAEVERLETEVEQTREELAAAQEVLLSQSAEGNALAERIARLEAQAGYTDVVGPGLVVTLDNAPGSDPADPEDPGRVLDQDVVQAVNGLWLSGAEAVAVNGVRLTSTTAIRAAGQAVLVDFRPLVPPYRIEGIGDPAAMAQAFGASASALELAQVAEQYGIRVTTEQAQSLALPASTALLPVRARVPRPAGDTVAGQGSASPQPDATTGGTP